MSLTRTTLARRCRQFVCPAPDPSGKRYRDPGGYLADGGGAGEKVSCGEIRIMQDQCKKAVGPAKPLRTNMPMTSG